MNTITRSAWNTLAAGLTVLALAACGVSTTEPDIELPPEVVGPALVDVPSVPVPSSPGGTVPRVSDTLTTIELLEGEYDFNPVVERAYAFWTLAETFNDGGTWNYMGLGNQWSHDMTRLESPSGVPPAPAPDPLIVPGSGAPLRLLLVDGGVPVEQSSQVNRRTYERVVTTVTPVGHRQHLTMDPRTFASEVYVRRDRRWELDSFSDGIVRLVASNETWSVTETYTQGSTQTDISSFGTTLTADAGLEFEGIRVGLQKTLTETFSTAVSVTVEQSQEITISISGEPGKLIDVRVWRLIDTYSLTDAAGDPLTDPSYEFDGSDSSMTWSTIVGTHAVQAKFGT